MQTVVIPEIGQRVHVYIQFLGDDQVSGPFDGYVQAIDMLYKVVPELYVAVSVDGELLHVDHVPYGPGHQTYWLPSA